MDDLIICRLRKVFPIETDLIKAGQSEAFDAVDSINKRHLKVLNWETADEAFHDKLFKLKTGSGTLSIILEIYNHKQHYK